MDLDSHLYKSLKICFEKVFNQEHSFIKIIDDKKMLDSFVSKASALRSCFSCLALVGMGGSSSGAKMLASSQKTDKDIIFFDNPDITFYKTLYRTNKDTHWMFISKSGKTKEVLTILKLVSTHLSDQGISLTKNITVLTTDTKNPLSKWAEKNKVNIDYIPDICGRFSVLGKVGMLPAAFMGLDIFQIHRQAKNAMVDLDMVIELATHVVQSFNRDEWIEVFWVYHNSLFDFGMWVSQLWSESLGKAKTRSNKVAPRVSTPMVLSGLQTQHSLLQQILDGSRDKFIWLIDDRTKNEAVCDITNMVNSQFESVIQMFNKKNISFLSLDLADSIGRAIVIFEFLVLVLAEFYDIDAFSQPAIDSMKS